MSDPKYQLGYLAQTAAGYTYLSKVPVSGSTAVFVTGDEVCRGGCHCNTRTPSINLLNKNAPYGIVGSHSQLHSHVKILITKFNSKLQLGYLAQTALGYTFLSKLPITGSTAVGVTTDSIHACQGGCGCTRRTPSINLIHRNAAYGILGNHSQLHCHVKYVTLN